MTVSGSITDVKLEQPANVKILISLVLPDMFTLFKLLQWEKTSFPNDEMFPRILSDVRLAHVLNAFDPIDVTLSGMINDVNPLCSNADCPINETLFGIDTEVNELMKQKAQFPIDAAPSLMTTLVIDEFHTFHGTG